MTIISINVQSGERTERDMTPEEIAAIPAYDPAPARRAEIQSRLAQIDLESIRAMRAKQLNRGKPADDAKLTALEDEADALRAELATLQ